MAGATKVEPVIGSCVSLGCDHGEWIATFHVLLDGLPAVRHLGQPDPGRIERHNFLGRALPILADGVHQAVDRGR